MKFVPLMNQVLVEPGKEIDLKLGNVLLPQKYQHALKRQEGKVLAVGPGMVNRDGKRIPLDVEAGMIVMYLKSLAAEIPTPTAENPKQCLHIMPENAVLSRVQYEPGDVDPWVVPPAPEAPTPL